MLFIFYLKNGMHMHMDMRRPMDMNMDIAHMHTRTCTHAYVRVQLHERCTASPPPAISDRKGLEVNAQFIGHSIIGRRAGCPA